MAIETWACKKTRDLFEGKRNTIVPPQVANRARIKLALLNAAVEVDFLRIPPGNRLEKLTGDRKDQWSIRINRQFRLCFSFRSGNAYDVEITDYH